VVEGSCLLKRFGEKAPVRGCLLLAVTGLEKAGPLVPNLSRIEGNLFC
jgi:hypothetical protein